MIRGLQQLGWKKVDVSFHSAIWPFFAHNNIHVLYHQFLFRSAFCFICVLRILFTFGLANFIFCKQVKNEWFHNAGAGVVAHVADSLKQQETLQDSNSFIVASL